jgi:hypothetical protein
VLDAPGRITPLDVLLAVGAGVRPMDNLVRCVRLMIWPAVLGGLTLLIAQWSAGVDYSGGYPGSIAAGYIRDVLWAIGKWLFAAGVVGVAWHHLPGRRGPVKVLPVVAAYASGSLVTYGVPYLFGGAYSLNDALAAGLFAAVLIGVGVRMDISVLRELNASRRLSRKQFITGYGVGNLPSRITVLLAPLTAAIAIFGSVFVSPSPEPSVDRTSNPSVSSTSTGSVSDTGR